MKQHRFITSSLWWGEYQIPLSRGLFSNLYTHWSNFFDKEILTPSALWRLTCWNYADNGSGNNGRVSSYEIDALLLKVLVEDGRWAGYSDRDNDEIVIISPEHYGKMELEERIGAEENCDYLKLKASPP